MANMSSVFFSGIITGVVISVSTLFFLLSTTGLDSQQKPYPQHQSKSTKNENDDENKNRTKQEEQSKPNNENHSNEENESQQQLSETIKLYSQQERTIIRDAISSLRTLKVRLDNEEIIKYCEDQKNLSMEALDRNFSELIKVGKDREKQIRHITTFFNDLSKVYSGTSKDLNKILSQINHSTTKTESVVVWDCWWPALSNATQKLSIDNESLAEVILKDIVAAFTKLGEDNSQVIRYYTSEGNQLTHLIKEHQSNVDSKSKDRDRCRERFDIAIEKSSTPITSTSKAASQADLNANTRLLQKLEAAEQALTDATGRLEVVQVEFMAKMPKLITDTYVFGFKITQDCKVQIVKFINMLQHMHGSNSIIAQSLRTEILSAFAPPESVFVELMGFETGLVRTLNALSESATGTETTPSSTITAAATADTAMTSTIAKSDEKIQDGSPTHNTATITATATPLKDSRESQENQARIANQIKLNMYSESTAILASCSPLILPTLPSSFASTVGVESCVWFNVLLGRMYRDMQKSPYFNYWFLAKAYSGFNKGTRPDYVDEFVLEDVMWGSLAPVLMNIHWVPATAATTATATATATANQTTPSVSESTTNPYSSPSPNTTQTNSKTSSTTEPSPPRSAYDHHWTADLTFRAGFKITISTKIWINWPRDKYVSIPISLSVELDELTGKLIVGMDEGSLWVSFLEEPFTRIKVITQVGEQFKLKDIPQLSAFMTKKMKGLIRSKLVYPNKHHLRLPWPRYWWSDDSQNRFMPTPIPTHLNKFHQLHPNIQNMIHTMNKVNFTQFENEMRLSPDWAKYISDNQFSVPSTQMNTSGISFRSVDSEDGDVTLGQHGKNSKSYSQKSSTSNTGNSVGNTNTNAASTTGSSTSAKPTLVSAGHQTRETAKKHLATVKETVKSKVSSWFKKIERVGTKVTHRAEDALDNIDIAIEKKWSNVVENLKVKRKIFVEKLKSDKRRQGATSNDQAPLRRSRSQNFVSQFNASQLHSDTNTAGGRASSGGGGGSGNMKDSTFIAPRNARAVSWAGDLLMLSSSSSSSLAILSNLKSNQIGNIGSTQLSYLVYNKEDHLNSTQSHSPNPNTAHQQQQHDSNRKRAWSLSDYRSEHLEAIAVQILYANVEQELRDEQHVLTTPSTLVDTQSRDHVKLSTTTANHPKFPNPNPNPSHNPSGMSPQYESTGNIPHQSSATSTDSNAAPIKNNLEWISKVAKDKYQKLKSSTVETYLLGSEQLQSQQQAGSAAGASTSANTGPKTGGHIEGGKKESFLDIGRRFLESNSASMKHSQQQQQQSQNKKSSSMYSSEPVIGDRVQQSSVAHITDPNRKVVSPLKRNEQSNTTLESPNKLHQVYIPSVSAVATTTSVIAPMKPAKPASSVPQPSVVSTQDLRTASQSAAQPSDPNHSNPHAREVCPQCQMRFMDAIELVNHFEIAHPSLDHPEPSVSERSLISRQFSKAADDPLIDPTAPTTTAPTTTTTTTKSVVTEVARLLDPESPVSPFDTTSPSLTTSDLINLDENSPSVLLPLSTPSTVPPVDIFIETTPSIIPMPISSSEPLTISDGIAQQSESIRLPVSEKSTSGSMINDNFVQLTPSPRSGLSRQLSKSGDSVDSKPTSPVSSPRESNLFRDTSTLTNPLFESFQPTDLSPGTTTATPISTTAAVAPSNAVVDDLIDFSLDDGDGDDNGNMKVPHSVPTTTSTATTTTTTTAATATINSTSPTGHDNTSKGADFSPNQLFHHGNNSARKPVATSTAVPPPASNPSDLMAKYKTKEKTSTSLLKAFEKARSKFGGTEM